MKKSENFFEKLFSGLGFTGSSRVPLRSNIFRGGPGSRGYSHIGGTNGARFFDSERESPLLGNAQPSSRISGYLDRMSELKSYFLLDITKMATNFFSDYVTNFLTKESQQIVTILNEDSTNNESVSERINNILSGDLKLVDYIRDHINDYIFYGGYYSMLLTQRDEQGHLVFRAEELNNPNAVVIKRKKNKDGIIEEVFLAIGDDGNLYEIPQSEMMYISNPKLRLTNDLEEGWKERNKQQKPKFGNKNTGSENRDKVRKKESYLAAEPLFYSSILKIKELIIKELLISLISLRDLQSPQLLGLQIDKNVPMESANELCFNMLHQNYF